MRNFSLVLLFFFCLSGCGGQPAAEFKKASVSPQLVVNLTGQVKETALEIPARLNLRSFEVGGNIHRIEVLLENPGASPLHSVRSWLAYTPSALKIHSLKLNYADFDFAAPGEDQVSPEDGLIRIGMSSTQGERTGKVFKLAELIVEKQSDGPVVVEFFDYHIGSDGHTSANAIVDDVVTNVLQKPEIPSLVL